jgi:hypothetical protein
MPKQKDLKRLVRARMRKTGESYTAARANIVAPPSPKPRASERAPQPDPAKLGGKSDAVMLARTGRTWAQWLALLDAAGGKTMPHGELAQHVFDLGVPGWWAQTVAVGYERIRGRREIGQRMDGSYEASKSKTLAAPVRAVYRALTHAPTRRKWIEVPVRVRTAVANKTVRMTWDDGTSVEAYLVAKGPAKTQLAIAHRKLSDRTALARAKQEWTARLGALEQLLHAR